MRLQGQASLRIDASAARLWSMVSDVSRMGEWSPETTGGQWIPPATAAVAGARFHGRNRRGRSRWTTVAEVVTADPGACFAFRAGRRKPSLWTYTFQPIEGGGCEVTESFDIPRYTWIDALSTKVTVGVADRQADLVAGCRLTLRRLKAVAEG